MFRLYCWNMLPVGFCMALAWFLHICPVWSFSSCLLYDVRMVFAHISLSSISIEAQAWMEDRQTKVFTRMILHEWIQCCHCIGIAKCAQTHGFTFLLAVATTRNQIARLVSTWNEIQLIFGFRFNYNSFCETAQKTTDRIFSWRESLTNFILCISCSFRMACQLCWLPLHGRVVDGVPALLASIVQQGCVGHQSIFRLGLVFGFMGCLTL